MLATLSVIAGTAALLVLVSVAMGASRGLKLSEPSAVPGQVVLLSGPGITKRAKVKIAGKKAKVVSKKRGKLGVEVPKVKPGKAAVVVRSQGRRLKGRLKIKRGFSGDIKPSLDSLRAASAEIGAGGGVVTATGSDGTTYELTVPAGALVAPATITLTPVASLGKFPGGGKAHAVQFAPDGLSFATPAALRITPPKPLADPVGLAYAGSGEDLTLAPASTVGGSLVVGIPHFTGGGGGSITEQDFENLVAAIAAQPISLEAAGHFFRDYRSVPASWCDSSHPTCRALSREISNFLGSLTTEECLEGVGSFIDLMRNELNALLGMEADALAAGFAGFPRLTTCRQALVTAMFDLTREPARNDALGFSSPCSGVNLANADYDGDGQNSKIECLLLVAAEAGVQQFGTIADAARDVIREGLQNVLDEGQTKCEGTNFEEGLVLLRKGLAIAEVSVLQTEFANALADCHEKIKVAPTAITLAPGAQTTFTATTNYLSPDIRWSADGGTIPAAGDAVQYTAPSTPGTYTVTATDFLIPGISATAIVTVQAPTVALSMRADYAAIVAGGATEETFPGAPLSGSRTVTISNTGATVSHDTNANDAGGQLAFSATETAHADSSSGYRGATSHEEISFTVSGSPVQIACSGSTSDDGIQDDSNQSGAAVIIDGVEYSGDAIIDHQAQLGPGTHTLETYAFAEAGAPAKTFDASVSVTCSTS